MELNCENWRRGKVLHQYIKTSKHQNLLSFRPWFLEPDLGGYVKMRMSHHVTLLVFQKTFSINILKQKINNKYLA
jgi:hypothetical protein